VRPTMTMAIAPPPPTGRPLPKEAEPVGPKRYLPSAKFTGQKPGYVFKRGDMGNGYYLDGQAGEAIAVREAAKAPASEAGSSSKKKPATVEESGGEAWCYKDMQGDVQGPFSIQQIYSWRKHLPPYLKVWQTQGAGGTRGSSVETTVHSLNKIAADGWLSMAQYSLSKGAPESFTTEYSTYNSTGYRNGRTGGIQADEGMWRSVDGRRPDVEQVFHHDAAGNVDDGAEYRNTGLDRYMDISTLHASMEARKNRKQPKYTREQIEKLKQRKYDVKKKIRLRQEAEEDARGSEDFVSLH